MQKIQLKLPQGTIIHLEAGTVEAVIIEGTVYVPMMSGLVVGEANPPSDKEVKSAPAAAAPATKVADDTKGTKNTKKAPAAKKPEAQVDKVIDDWTTLEVGQNILVDLEGKGKKFSAEVTAIDGEQVTVLFHEDNTSDTLMEGDIVYEFQVV